MTETTFNIFTRILSLTS